MACMPGLIDDLKKFELTSIPQLDRLIKATSYKMFAIRAKTEGIDGIHVSDNLRYLTVIASRIPCLQTCVAGATEQKTAVGTITKGKYRIGMGKPLLF